MPSPEPVTGNVHKSSSKCHHEDWETGMSKYVILNFEDKIDLEGERGPADSLQHALTSRYTQRKQPKKLWKILRGANEVNE